MLLARPAAGVPGAHSKPRLDRPELGLSLRVVGEWARKAREVARKTVHWVSGPQPAALLQLRPPGALQVGSSRQVRRARPPVARHPLQSVATRVDRLRASAST